ncbi:hypothetical protein TEU_01070 [Thermococcus eurythermalis]|uniref:Uncharacterized protein n=1 Tax=Thermococcus eurythermalis TaxID=1505907 RepID=A0A097QRD8_9EURY|nr:hypothetical protein [Thermococcus eurythermalis]AIU69041.1 hypothetical protein TEU_01070 [Thermococcus eurythermalis]
MRWKPLLAVLLGLLMVGVTAGSAMAVEINNDSKHLSGIVLVLKGRYYPHSWKGNYTKSSPAQTVARFNMRTHELTAIFMYEQTMEPTRYKVRILKSHLFNGYALLPIGSSQKHNNIHLLEIIVYDNGTIQIFAKDHKGNLIALSGYSRSLIRGLHLSQFPSEDIPDNLWIMSVTPIINGTTKIVKVPTDYSTMATRSTSVSKVIEYQYTAKAAHWNVTFYITFKLYMYGPTSLDNYGKYRVSVSVLDKGVYYNKKHVHHNGVPLSIGNIKPIEIGFIVPNDDNIKDRIISTQFSYHSPSDILSKLAVGWDLLVGGFNPITVVDTFFNIKPDVKLDLRHTDEPPNAIHVKFENVPLWSPEDYVEGLFEVDHSSGVGSGTITTFFAVPLYYKQGKFHYIETIKDKLKITAEHLDSKTARR